MKARIKWVENASFLGITESNHAILMDGPPEGGGQNLGPRPMETLLVAEGVGRRLAPWTDHTHKHRCATLTKPKTLR